MIHSSRRNDVATFQENVDTGNLGDTKNGVMVFTLLQILNN